MSDPHRLSPDKKIRLSERTTRGRDFRDDRSAAEDEFEQLREEMIELQNRLYAEGRRSLLVVLQAMDAGGKDGAIRNIFRGVNPQGVRVASFKVPTHQELSHDYLWRTHQETPAAGMFGVFNRSHYEDVLVVRVENLVPQDVWEPRFEHINDFERMLSDSGTAILKFFLHISKEEQKERFEDRLNRPEKHWKFSPQDLVKREHWDAYQDAYEDVLNRCNTPYAPWYVIPADQKWYRNLVITRAIVETLREMDPQYPAAVEDLDQYQVDD
jgi:PPK2 family polyphosphate:nucleotide phosphotransferase